MLCKFRKKYRDHAKYWYFKQKINLFLRFAGISGLPGQSGNPGAPGIAGIDGCNGTDGLPGLEGLRGKFTQKNLLSRIYITDRI